MTIIVTGGAGFIGSNFIFYMLKEHPQDRIVCLDSLTYAGNLSTLAPVMDQPNFRFVKLDICDRPGVYTLFEEEKPDVIVNFAAESHVDRSIENPEVFLQTNIIGTSVLMDACRKYGISRYHQVSTDEVYGTLRPGEPAFTETTPYAPNSPYSASKASSDHFVRAYHETYGLPTLITNCSNNYGPRQFPEKLIPLVILNALSGKPLPIYGTGENIRDWLHVEDHCEAIVAVLEKGAPGECYNIGGHSERANIDVVRSICRILDKLRPTAAPYEKQITFVADRPGHDLRYAIDAAKIEQEIGWVPRRRFEEGLRETVGWYLENAAWVENIQSGEYRQWLETNYSGR
mgnify:CR=1 FL=1